MAYTYRANTTATTDANRYQTRRLEHLLARASHRIEKLENELAQTRQQLDQERRHNKALARWKQHVDLQASQPYISTLTDEQMTQRHGNPKRGRARLLAAARETQPRRKDTKK